MTRRKSLWLRLRNAAKEIKKLGLWGYLCKQVANGVLVSCMPYEKGWLKVWVLRTMASRFPRSLQSANAIYIAEGYLTAMYYEQYGSATLIARILITRQRFASNAQERIFCKHVYLHLSEFAPQGAERERVTIALKRMGYRLTPDVQLALALQNEAPRPHEKSSPFTGERSLREVEDYENPLRFRVEAHKALTEKRQKMIRSGRKPSVRRSFA